jgi:hypothetical protein
MPSVNPARLLLCAIASLLLSSCSSAVGPGTTPTSRISLPRASESNVGQLPQSPSGALGWAKQSVSDPALQLDVPDGWQGLPLDVFERQLKEQLPNVSADAAKVWRYQIELIDTGQVRAVFTGPSAAFNATASIEVIVLPGSETLTEAVSREQKAAAALIEGQRDQTDATLPIGSAIRVLVLTDPEGGVPSQGIQYFVKLDDGTTLMLIGSAPAADTEFAEVMSHVAQSLSRAP